MCSRDGERGFGKGLLQKRRRRRGPPLPRRWLARSLPQPLPEFKKIHVKALALLLLRLLQVIGAVEGSSSLTLSSPLCACTVL